MAEPTELGDVALEHEAARLLVTVLPHLDAFERDLLRSMVGSDDENSDEEIAERHGTTIRFVRRGRSLLRIRLNELIRLRRESCW